MQPANLTLRAISRARRRLRKVRLTCFIQSSWSEKAFCLFCVWGQTHYFFPYSSHLLHLKIISYYTYVRFYLHWIVKRVWKGRFLLPHLAWRYPVLGWTRGVNLTVAAKNYSKYGKQGSPVSVLGQILHNFFLSEETQCHTNDWCHTLNFGCKSQVYLGILN